MPTIQSVIVTTDIDRLLRFYQTVFGATEFQRVPEDGPAFYVMLKIGDSELGLVAVEKATLDGPQRMLLSVAVTDVDGLLSAVESAGGTVLGPPNDMPWGQRVAHVTDPDGNRVNLTRMLAGA